MSRPEGWEMLTDSQMPIARQIAARRQEHDSWEGAPEPDTSQELEAAAVFIEAADGKECAARGDGGPHEFSVGRCRFCDRPVRRSL
jgi:hypothetical protein